MKECNKFVSIKELVVMATEKALLISKHLKYQFPKTAKIQDVQNLNYFNTDLSIRT